MGDGKVVLDKENFESSGLLDSIDGSKIEITLTGTRMKGIANGNELKETLTESGPIETTMADEQLISPSRITTGGMGRGD